MSKITFIDIDETLFFTKAKIIIKDLSGNILKKISSEVFNEYKKKDEEVFDFSEFRCAKLFVSTSTPNNKMLEETKRVSDFSEVYLLTARADFDDRDIFLDFLKYHNINVGHKDENKIHVIRAGNLKNGTTAEKKYSIIKKILNDSNYNEVRLYDDAVSNLSVFSNLKFDFPKTDVRGFLIKNGNITKYKES